MDDDIKQKTEILVDGFLRRLFNNQQAKINGTELPLALNRLCIKFMYIKLIGVGQVIMWRIFNGTLNSFISDGKLASIFNCSSEKKVEIAEHCVENQIIAPLKIMMDNVFCVDSDLLLLLTISAIKHASFGGLSVLLTEANNVRQRNNAPIMLYNAFKYQCHNEELIIYIMKKLGMMDNVFICKEIAKQLIKRNFPATLRLIVNDYGTQIAGCDHVKVLLSNNGNDDDDDDDDIQWVDENGNIW